VSCRIETNRVIRYCHCLAIFTRSVLEKMPRPMTLAMAQFATINLVLPILMSMWNKRRRNFDSRT
jgi:hypothetical protein